MLHHKNMTQGCTNTWMEGVTDVKFEIGIRMNFEMATQFFSRNIYSCRVTRKERNRVGTKFSEGQLFIFRDRQDSCLPSAARLDSPGDQGKGKVGPRKILFLQDFSFLSG